MKAVGRHMNRFWIFVIALLVTVHAQNAYAQGHEDMMAQHSEVLKATKVYPNPATDYLVIHFEAPIARTVSLQLHSIIGNELEPESEVVDEYEIHLKVKDLPTGYYLLAVKDDSNQRTAFKFLKR